MKKIKKDILKDTRRDLFVYLLYYGDYGNTSISNKLGIKNRSNTLEEGKIIVDSVSRFGSFATLNKHILTGSSINTFGKSKEIYITKQAFIKLLDDSFKFNLTRKFEYYVKENYNDTTREVITTIGREKFWLGINYTDVVTYVRTISHYYDYVINLININLIN